MSADFDALRAKRNEAVQASMQKLADEEGIPLQSLRHNFNPDACYCACGHGEPPYLCEHKWDGACWESQDGASSMTCSRCGTTAMSHDLRVLP